MIEPFYADDWFRCYEGDATTVLASLPEESVHAVVTSPPYWSLRDYGTASWEGGDPSCDHTSPTKHQKPGKTSQRAGRSNTEAQRNETFRGTCPRCGAVRVDAQLGLEPTPEEYIARLVGICREIRRVLRKDGTFWLVLGDSYVSAGGSHDGRDDNQTGVGAKRVWRDGTGRADGVVDASGQRNRNGATVKNLSAKNLVGIPWRVALALQADGWFLRSDIIWAKPNAMPEPVTDRPAKAHEYVFLLSRSPRYFYDAEAVREAAVEPTRTRSDQVGGANGAEVRHSPGAVTTGSETRHLRDVWAVASEPHAASHFAAFPQKLVVPMIRAATSARGVCSECGAPRERIVKVEKMVLARSSRTHSKGQTRASGTMLKPRTSETTGWRATCAHAEAKVVPATVLDPFAGTGTVGIVARKYLRRSVLIDLEAMYLRDRVVVRAETEVERETEGARL